MRLKSQHFVFIATFISGFINLAYSQDELQDNKLPEVTLERTEIRTIQSFIVGQDYELYISLPRSYHTQGNPYPVVYLLDSYRAFAMMKGFLDLLMAPFNIIPDLIIVGIGYGGKDQEALLNWVVGRTRDLTPARDTLVEANWKMVLDRGGASGIDIQTGGAPLFIDFVQNELFPFIELNYTVDPARRILSGYSYGGLFTLYTLFHKPEMFTAYLIGSPSIDYFKGITYNYEANYAKKNSDLKADIFMSSGELEKVTALNIEKMAELLLSHNYPGLRLKTFSFQKENHVTCYPVAISRGLTELFNMDSK